MEEKQKTKHTLEDIRGISCWRLGACLEDVWGGFGDMLGRFTGYVGKVCGMFCGRFSEVHKHSRKQYKTQVSSYYQRLYSGFYYMVGMPGFWPGLLALDQTTGGGGRAVGTRVVEGWGGPGIRVLQNFKKF